MFTGSIELQQLPLIQAMLATIIFFTLLLFSLLIAHIIVDKSNNIMKIINEKKEKEEK